MITETIQTIRKKKPAKSYDELLKEIKSLFRKSAAVYVPELCTALAVEHLDWSNEKIKNKVFDDLEGFWSPLTVEDSLPSWIHDPSKVATSKKGWETRNANKVSSASKILAQLEKVDLPPPPPIREESGINDEKLHDLGLGSYGGSDKTIFRVRNDIHEGARLLFKALCDDKNLPDDGDDLLVDFIKPTREYRLGLAMELDKNQRTNMHNVLHCVIEAAEDMIEQLDKADKK